MTACGGDVSAGDLPAVSWLVAPQEFSDHPSSAWYGAWYVSEALDILTQNPDIWKKTVFLLCYDENDGYFDHIPPFVAPHPTRAETGKASVGVDTAVEWANVHDHEHSIGLGFRVPMVIASPWSRGGVVNSQVFDHTSILMFLERWLAGKGKPVVESNISTWRRTVCGDLTSAFRPFEGETIDLPKFLDRDETVERIHAAKFRSQAIGGAPLGKDVIASMNVGAYQESGTRPSCPLPYDLAVNAEHMNGGVVLTMSARRGSFGEAAQGAAFNVYSYVPDFSARAYAVKVDDTLTDTIPVGATYRIRVDGPNGFMREFTSEQTGAGGGESEEISVNVDQATGNPDARLAIRLHNRGSAGVMVALRDRSYGAPVRRVVVPARGAASTTWDANATRGWYDLSVETETFAFRYAGRIETGTWSITDPAMGERPGVVA